MNTYDELQSLRLKLNDFKILLSNYQGDISPKKVIAKLDKIMEVKK